MIALMYFSPRADEYNVCDAMVYPQADPTKSKGLFAGAFCAVSSRLFGQATEVLSDLRQMRNLCLQIYLHDDLDLIRTGGIAKRGIDILRLFTRITTVHHNLCYCYLQDGRKKQIYNWFCQHLLHASNKRFHVIV